MAKWIYEKWSIKWDNTGFTSGGGNTKGFRYKVDIATMVASEVSSMAVGDVMLISHINDYNSGKDVSLHYMTAISNLRDMQGGFRKKSGIGANKEWLANQRIKDARQADVILEEGTVPDDGIHTDGYWYVKVKKAFPEIEMAKWIYERWTPKWPQMSGSRYSFATNHSVRQLSYDGTLQDSKNYSLLTAGDVFYSGSAMVNIVGYYQQRPDFYSNYLGKDPPLAIKDTLVDTIIAGEGAFPDDGVHSDQLYYVKVKEAFPGTKMAKWIYEKYELAWDPSMIGSSSTTRSAFARVDIRTMEAIETSVFEEGDIAINIEEAVKNYNSGNAISYIKLIEPTTTGRGRAQSTISRMTKNQLASMRIKGTLIGTVKVEEGTYPDDGIHTDGYWYVKVKKAFPGIKVVDGTTLKTATSAYIVQDGQLKNVSDIYIVQDG